MFTIHHCGSLYGHIYIEIPFAGRHDTKVQGNLVNAAGATWQKLEGLLTKHLPDTCLNVKFAAKTKVPELNLSTIKPAIGLASLWQSPFNTYSYQATNSLVWQSNTNLGQVETDNLAAFGSTPSESLLQELLSRKNLPHFLGSKLTSFSADQS